MFIGVVYVTICSGWLCRQVHGDEIEISPAQRFTTREECLAITELAARWSIGDGYHWRVDCKEAR